MKEKISRVTQMLLTIVMIGGIIYACAKNRFDKEDFLNDLYVQKTDPEIKTALNFTLNLQNEWAVYATNPIAENFTRVKTEFVALANHLENINFYNLGNVGAVHVFNRFYKTTIDTTEIKENYNAAEVFNELTISEYTNTQKGIFTLEYLLYGKTFQDSLTDPKFINFVNAHLIALNSAIIDFQNSWNAYEKNFIESEGSGVSDSYNIVLNRIIAVLEDLIVKRITPIIDENNPSLGIGFLSNQSLQKIKIQVQQISDVYRGVGVENFNSIHTNLHKKNKKLAEKVLAKFDEIIAFGGTMTQEMAYYIDNDEATLLSYKSKLIDLLAYFKGDVQAELEYVITFGDTDGD